jgi:hypothetical protein
VVLTAIAFFTGTIYDPLSTPRHYADLRYRSMATLPETNPISDSAVEPLRPRRSDEYRGFCLLVTLGCIRTVALAAYLCWGYAVVIAAPMLLWLYVQAGRLRIDRSTVAGWRPGVGSSRKWDTFSAGHGRVGDSPVSFRNSARSWEDHCMNFESEHRTRGETKPRSLLHALISDVVVILALVCGTALAAAKTPRDSASSGLDSARWMQTHLEAFGKRPLRQLVLPASHDSGMYESGFPQSLGQTQDSTIYGQLAFGIRYFDIRPQWHDGGLYVHHGPIRGPKLDTVLQDVRRFLHEGHRELILLKFSHYDGFHNQAYQTMAKPSFEAETAPCPSGVSATA